MKKKSKETKKLMTTDEVLKMFEEMTPDSFVSLRKAVLKAAEQGQKGEIRSW